MKFLYGLDRSEEFSFVTPRKGLIGWIRKDLPEDLFLYFIRDPEGVFHDPSSKPLKDGPRTKVVKQTLTGRGGLTRDVVIKRFHYSSFWRRLASCFFASRATRSLEGALVLESAGVDTAIPLAAFEYRDWENLGTSYCISEEVKNSQSLPAFWKDISAVSSKERAFRERREVLREVAFHFYRLHSREIYHQDLKGGNILIRRSDTGKWRCFFIDVDGVWRNRRLSQSKKVKNLAQLYRTLGKLLNITNKVFFLKCYAELFSLSRQERKTLAQRVMSLSRKEDLRSLRKRVKRIFARAAL